MFEHLWLLCVRVVLLIVLTELCGMFEHFWLLCVLLYCLFQTSLFVILYDI
jgi:hypothetical protein